MPEHILLNQYIVERECKPTSSLIKFTIFMQLIKPKTIIIILRKYKPLFVDI